VRKQEEDEAAKLVAVGVEAQEAEIAESNDQVGELIGELAQIEASFLEQGYTKENNPSVVNNNPQDPAAAAAAANASSLLARAKTAEAAAESYKKQLAAVLMATTAAAASTNKGASDGGAGGGGAIKASSGSTRRTAGVTPHGGGGGGGGGADPAEIRKLNRKIKELETQLKNGGGGGGGGGGGVSSAESKAMLQNEKALQKKIKDLENNFKRDSKATEMRAVKAENALQKIEATHNSVVSERDRLRAETAKLAGLGAELATLKAKTEYFEQVEVQLGAKTKEYDLLAEQFKKETTLRKKYKNELEDLKGAIRVYARCRPMAKYELEKGCKSVVDIKDETSLRVVTTRGDKDFEFDAVFGDNSTQDAVFEDTKRLVESCIDGFNVCLFAYGQTGSGKTFTMTGSKTMPGLTPKAIDELFSLIHERVHLNVKVTTYFVELYNDNLVDLYWLLDNKKVAGSQEPPKLEIKMDNKKMVYIRGSVIKEVSSPGELMDLFNAGNLERHTGATMMNAESSRSHSIFAVMVECYDTATKRSTSGKLSLVDLAGSERADKTGAAAERLKYVLPLHKFRHFKAVFSFLLVSSFTILFCS
jgi:DNA replication protein DnaC